MDSERTQQSALLQELREQNTRLQQLIDATGRIIVRSQALLARLRGREKSSATSATGRPNLGPQAGPALTLRAPQLAASTTLTNCGSDLCVGQRVGQRRALVLLLGAGAPSRASPKLAALFSGARPAQVRPLQASPTPCPCRKMRGHPGFSGWPIRVFRKIMVNEVRWRRPSSKPSETCGDADALAAANFSQSAWCSFQRRE